MAKKKTKTKSVKKIKIAPEIWGLIALTSAIFLLLSLYSFAGNQEAKNLLGLAGLLIGFLFHASFGISSYILCLYLIWLGAKLVLNKSLEDLFSKSFYTILLVISNSIILSVIEEHYTLLANGLSSFFYSGLKAKHIHYHLGGAPFFYLYRDLPFFNLQYLLNWIGVLALFSTTWLASFLYLSKNPLVKFFTALKLVWEKLEFTLPEQKKLKPEPALANKEEETSENADSDFMRYVKLRSASEEAPVQEVLEIKPETVLKKRPSLSEKSVNIVEPEKPNEVEKPKKQVLEKKEILPSGEASTGSITELKLPQASLLTNAKKVDQSLVKKDLRRQAEVLEETLLSFGIEAKVGQINCGPTITSFEVHPSIGVKVQKIKTLENDIALNMEAKSIRIIAPIPGKAAVGIEVPNPYPQEVGFKEMLTAYQQGENKLRIPILLGKAVNGDYVMSDLTKWPHCIIAGATGSGKSVCINTIVMSIVMNAKPDEVKLLMVDPKKVELTSYSSLPHMLAPVITEPKDACTAMNWLVKEMEKRYEILKLIGVRNIEAFNNRQINKDHEAALQIEIPEKMPYLVGLVDELADLMMVSSSDIETPIARIAQMARAVGIHLILATQRPSREVITGLIKANFPTRISFKVASRVNSQIVLDETGAETLLGNGDMLFLPPGTSHLIRAQGAYLRDEDIAAVVKYLSAYGPNYLIPSFSQLYLSDDAISNDEDLPEDALYKDALDTILSTGNASTTFLQRKLKIGYARAASLIDQLESRGVVGPAEGAKPRKILMRLRGESAEEILEQD